MPRRLNLLALSALGVSALALLCFTLITASPSHADDSTATATSTPTAMPAPTSRPTTKIRVMVALVFGQSNAANFGESARIAGPKVFNFYKGKLYRARDPLRGANGQSGSVWTRLGDKLIAAGMFDKVIFVPVAIGATEIAQWAPDGALHELILKTIDDAKRRGLKFTHLLWHQGESDAVLFTSKADYEARFTAMLDSIRARGVDAPVFIAIASRCGKYAPSPEIRQAQIELVNPALGVYSGPDTDTLDETYRYDACHFSNDGLDRHAEMWLQTLKAYAGRADDAGR